MKLDEYLSQHREPVPSWLARFREGDPFPREEFFRSRVVFYPGCGGDEHPIRLFGGTGSAHCFVMADYLNDLSCFGGLARVRFRVPLRVGDLTPAPWTAHVLPSELRRSMYDFVQRNGPPPGATLLVVEEHGGAARRDPLAIILLHADGIAAYDALFCQSFGHLPPYAVLLQDHGFGGNYDSFGGGGLMERIAARTSVFPTWLLVGRGTRPWAGYERVPAVESDRGGMYNLHRHLYRRCEGQAAGGMVNSQLPG